MFSIKFLLVSLIGAISNRIRGGGLTDYVNRRPKLINLFSKIGLYKDGGVNGVKDMNAVFFALTFGLLTKLYASPFYYLAMRVALALGWGGYIGAMIDRKIYHNRDDVTILDKWFRSDKHPVLSGWAALSVRGLMATIILALPFIYFTSNWLSMMLVGLTMGSCYLLACEVCQRITTRGNGWQWGEIIFGGVLWGSYCFFLLK